MILDEILAHKREEVIWTQALLPLAEVQARGVGRRSVCDLAAALRRPGVGLIAEVKRASPSKGVMAGGIDPVALALTYAANGAAAISVLTDRRFFKGELDDLRQIKAALVAAGYETPVLRKDFILDPYQVYEAYAAGADALLLIAAALPDGELAGLLALTHQLGMTALVEVHDAAEAARVVPLQPGVVGINQRDLRDFSIDRGRFAALRPLLPAGAVAVAESGIHTEADVCALRAAGADAILVGEALVTAADIGAQVRALVTAGSA